MQALPLPTYIIYVCDASIHGLVLNGVPQIQSLILSFPIKVAVLSILR